jgi:hypothetical protein
MKKLILFISFICITNSSNAQINEIGLFIGGSNYIGDIGSEFYINPNNLMGGIIYKWNVNPQMALRGNFTYAQISANDAKSNNSGRELRGLKFTNTVMELAVGVEYSFFEYNVNSYNHTQTPYLLLQIAAFNHHVVKQEIAPLQYEYGSKISVAIPFGVGYKFKIARDFAMAFEIRAAYTFTDELDYNNQNIESLTFGNPNNNDWYVFTGISFVYAFGRPSCYATPY